jgi:hypothetical protein
MAMHVKKSSCGMWSGNPGQYMNMFKIPTTLNDGQQQSVDDYIPRANLKLFLKTVPFIHQAIVR